jgi:hypothetical protein
MMVKLNEYLTTKHGILVSDAKAPVIAYRPFLDSYFILDFLYKSPYTGPYTGKRTGALFSITQGRIERHYALVRFKEDKIESVHLDLTPELVPEVLFHLGAYKKRLHEPLWSDDSPQDALKEKITEAVEKAIRKQYGIGLPPEVKVKHKDNVIPLRRK